MQSPFATAHFTRRSFNLVQAIIEGFDISRDMDSVYALMGACPQHDLLWDGLTGVRRLSLLATCF